MPPGAALGSLLHNPRLAGWQCMIACADRDGCSVPYQGRTCHEIAHAPYRAFDPRLVIDNRAVRTGRVANSDWIRRHASSRHRRRAGADGKTASGGANHNRSGLTPDRTQPATILFSSPGAVLCPGLGDGEDCRPGEGRQQLQRRLRDELSTGQRALDRLQRVGRQHRVWTFLANVPGHHHPQFLPRLRRDQDVSGRESKQGALALQQPGRRQPVQGCRTQAVQARALIVRRGLRAPFSYLLSHFRTARRWRDTACHPKCDRRRRAGRRASLFPTGSLHQFGPLP